MHVRSLGQGALEYLLLIGGAVLIAAIVLTLLSNIGTNQQSITQSRVSSTQCNYLDRAHCVDPSWSNLDNDPQNTADCAWDTLRNPQQCVPIDQVTQPLAQPQQPLVEQPPTDQPPAGQPPNEPIVPPVEPPLFACPNQLCESDLGETLDNCPQDCALSEPEPPAGPELPVEVLPLPIPSNVTIDNVRYDFQLRGIQPNGIHTRVTPNQPTEIRELNGVSLRYNDQAPNTITAIRLDLRFKLFNSQNQRLQELPVQSLNVQNEADWWVETFSTPMDLHALTPGTYTFVIDFYRPGTTQSIGLIGLNFIISE